MSQNQQNVQQSGPIRQYKPLTCGQKLSIIMRQMQLPSFNLPIHQSINWALVVQIRTTLNFIAFIILLWFFYCPSGLLGTNQLQVSSQLICTFVLAIEYIIDVFLTLFSLTTFYTNLIVVIIMPLNCILIVVRNFFNERWKVIVSAELICVSNSLVFAASIIHIICVAIGVGDIKFK